MPGSCSNQIGSTRVDKNHQQTGTKPTPLRSSDEKYVGVEVGVGSELGGGAEWEGCMQVMSRGPATTAAGWVYIHDYDWCENNSECLPRFRPVPRALGSSAPGLRERVRQAVPSNTH